MLRLVTKRTVSLPRSWESGHAIIAQSWYLGGTRRGRWRSSSSTSRSPSAADVSDPNVVRSPFQDISVPEDLTIPKFVWREVDKWAHLPALTCAVTGRSYLYREARELSRRVGSGLLDGHWWSTSGSFGTTSGPLRAGHVIATLLPNTPEYPLVVMGALEAGLTVTTVNPNYTPAEISKQLLDSGSVCLVTVPELVDRVAQVKQILAESNRHQAETLKVIVAPSCNEGGSDGSEDLPGGYHSLMRLMNEHVGSRELEREPVIAASCLTGSDIAFVPYSSGTTGLPKGVCLTHTNIISNLIQIGQEEIKNQSKTTKDHQEVIPVVLPMFHIYGLSILMLQGLSLGVRLITLPKFDEQVFLNSLMKYKATVLYVAPPLILYLGSSPKVTPEHLKTVRVTVSGAAPVGESDILKCLHKSPPGTTYKQGFGLTECSPAVCCSLKGSKNYDSVGPPLASTLVKVVDTSTGQSLPPHTTGEICVKGPQVTKGYLNNPEANRESFDEDGWYHTGDIGHYDDNRHFYVVDRLKELIKVKGYQVAPAELEEVIRSHAGVVDAGVIGVSDSRYGEVPVAFVRPASTPSGGDHSNQQQLQQLTASLQRHLADKLADYKRVSRYIYVESIPKSPAGKILRKNLKALYADKYQSQS